MRGAICMALTESTAPVLMLSKLQMSTSSVDLSDTVCRLAATSWLTNRHINTCSVFNNTM